MLSSLIKIVLKIIYRLHFPICLQRDTSECGSTCLSMLLSFYGIPNTQPILRDMTNVGRAGASLLKISEVANQIGFATEAYQLDVNQLNLIKLPCIAHYQGNHFIVIYKIRKDLIYVANPAFGKEIFSKQEFAQKWNGVVLTITPTEKINTNVNFLSEVKEQRKLSLKKWRSQLFFWLREYKWGITAILLFSIILQVLGLALPVITQLIIDKVILQQNKQLLSLILLWFIVIFFLQIGFTYLRNIFLLNVKMGFELDFFSSFFERFIHLKQEYFDKYRREDFIHRFQLNIKLRKILSPSILQSFVDFVLVLNLLFVLFYFQALLAGIVLFFIVTLLLTTLLFTPKLKDLENTIFYENLETLSQFLDSLLGIQTIKLFRLESLKIDEWSKKYRQTLNKLLLMEKKQIKLQTFLRAIYLLSYATIFWIGAYMTLEGLISIGRYVAFTGLFTLIMTSLNSVLILWFIVIELVVNYSKISDVFLQETEPTKNDEITLANFEELHMHNLSYKYPSSQHYAIKNISFTLKPGERIAIIGKNGSGKTTLAKIMTKLYTDYEGDITYNGINISKIPPKSFRERIFMLPQEVYLFSGTIKENISYGNPSASDEEIIEAAKMVDVHEFISSLYFGYEQKISDNGSSLSEGQKLKIALARLFLSKPEVIILDESNSALDIESENIIINNLLNRFKDKTLIFITHRIQTLINVERIMVLSDGQLKEDGTHQDLLSKKGLYFNFVTSHKDTNISNPSSDLLEWV